MFILCLFLFNTMDKRPWRHNPNNRHVLGFSLIEILITVVIIGILAAISLPSYQSSIAAGRRGEAKAELLRLAQAEAKWRVGHTAYGDLKDLGSTITNENYTFDVLGHTATAFLITAMPTSTNGQNQDVCGTLTIREDAVIRSGNSTLCPKP
jgi:type IV pilus assembly protein PilE